MEEGYSICLNEWALDKDIKNELGLLLIISSLTAEKGYCYANNSYLANLFDTDEAQISKKISKLVKKGYLVVSYVKRGAEVTSREIRLSKMTTDRCQNSQPTDVKNDKENNINNKNNKLLIKEKVSKDTLKKDGKKEYAEFVTMTDEEYNKLVNEYGEDFTKRCIETLDNYKGSSGKKYKNDYRAILSWVVSRVQKDTQSYKPKRGCTFSDILEEEYGTNDEKRNGRDTDDNADILSEVLSEYDIE